jgi:hypothetical protein
MTRYIATLNLSALLLSGILTTPLCAGRAGADVRIVDATTFTGTVAIPADADTRSIRFESLKSVRLPGRPRTEPLTSIEVTYSYTGEPLASDEHGDRQFTFQVYFQLSGLPVALREALSGGRKPRRAQLSRLFEVSTYRAPVPRYVLDERRSVLCDGTYLDGSWQPDDDCDETIRTKAVPGLSDFLTVKVTPVK